VGTFRKNSKSSEILAFNLLPIKSPDLSMSAPVTPLCLADDATFWPWFTWSDFAQWPDPDSTTVILPMAGFTDWGLGHAYDAEEQVLTHVLRAASQLTAHSERPRLLVVPPMRYMLGPAGRSVFAFTPPEVIEFTDNLAESIAAAGFRRVVLFNASPWNEEIVDVMARDLRVQRELQMFCVNLSALDLDFHPTRSRSRRQVQTLLTHLSGRLPETPEASAGSTTVEWGVDVFPPLRETPATLKEAAEEGPKILAAAAAHLASLLAEIAARPALPHQGKILRRTYP
jgi:creatinine amidohydrolase/Fe(II)-dependent formamide hydrolase-like protein